MDVSAANGGELVGLAESRARVAISGQLPTASRPPLLPSNTSLTHRHGQTAFPPTAVPLQHAKNGTVCLMLRGADKPTTPTPSSPVTRSMTGSLPPTPAKRLPNPSERTSPPTRPAFDAPFDPVGDTATYRDLLLFEERLKMNAEMLRRRRRRYSAFLWTFLGTLFMMGYRLVFLPPESLLKLRVLQAALAVVLITLALFFASGMYEEKIRYAHSYINHSNKALRPLNMHLNMRRPRPPLLSYLPLPVSLRPLPPHLDMHNSQAHKAQTAQTSLTPIPNGRFLHHRQGSNNTVLAHIPPSSNPRGELIFSSRVDRSFREGYERYRSAFERRREEKAREEAKSTKRGFLGWKIGRKDGLAVGTGGGTRSMTSTPTPPLSRRETPPPGVGGAARGRTPSPGPSRLGRTGEDERGRERGESYSFVWSAADTGPRRAP